THMVPATLTPLTALPLTPNGKLDPTQLPAPRPRQQPTTPVAEAVAAAPLTPAEAALRAVWVKVLGQEDIGAADNFFSLGGDSITAIRLVSQARAAGIDFGVEDLFLNPTLGELAAVTAPTTEPAATPAPLAPLPAGLPADVEDAYPLAALQLGMLYHVELSGDPSLYHDLTGVRVHAAWSPESLRHALDVLTARHEILRTSFELAEYDEPLQLVHRAGSVRIPVEVEDLTTYGAQEQDKALADWWERESATAFDLTRAPLVRVHVGLRGADDFQLSVSVHHILLDGWSFARLMTELLDVYEDHLAGGSGRELPALPAVRYRDFVAAERAVAASAEARAYWARLLDGVRPLALPPATPAAAEPADEAGPSTLRVLPAPLAEGVRRAADRLGVPVKSVYLAAHLWALGRLTGESDVVSGLCGNGRAEAEGSELVLGVFLNVVPVRMAVGADTDWAALVRAAFDAERAHLPYRGYPLSRMAKDLGFEPFPVMFNYTDFHTVDAVATVGSLRADDWSYADRTNFPLLVEVNKLAAGLGTELSITVDPQETRTAVGPRLAGLLHEALTHLTHHLAPAI
ncbi:condensation domain-containing protein, partial [Streptomyces sp. NPDC090022]|uniref:condensation domain-containing protein n=1 Tax=Streptomyces sp. NPDC090022 TaxID=3365920 RepID=UPI003827D4DB